MEAAKKYRIFDTLSQTMDALTNDGYTEDFKALDTNIKALYSGKEYKPEDLRIIYKFRFEGMTDPSDQSELFAIEANDGTKGTLAMVYNSQSNQNTDLILRIEELL